MGCTSSAPSHTVPPPSPYANATVKDIEELSEKRDILEAEKKVKMELSSCDTIVEQVASDMDASMVASGINQPSLINIETPVEDLPKETRTEDLNIENETDAQAKSISRIQSEDKSSRLEEVVEKVVELKSTTDTVALPQNGEIAPDVAETSSNEDKGQNKAPNELQKKEEVEMEIANLYDEEKGGPVSPSESASSRATRWEALADIAAELPPSLTVDPLTGQIYALSK